MDILRLQLQPPLEEAARGGVRPVDAALGVEAQQRNGKRLELVAGTVGGLGLG